VSAFKLAISQFSTLERAKFVLKFDRAYSIFLLVLIFSINGGQLL
jgi:hypothetical protein